MRMEIVFWHYLHWSTNLNFFLTLKFSSSLERIILGAPQTMIYQCRNIRKYQVLLRHHKK